MATTGKLNKELWTNITRLKLLGKPNTTNRFILESNPFDDEDEEKVAVEKDEYVIKGKIFPSSNIYKETALRIEMKLTSAYPIEAPVVRFLTPVYHPNVESDGTFCHQLLSNASRWKQNRTATLADVIKAIAKHIDEPDPDYSINFDIGKEFMENRAEFDRKASEMVRRNMISRD
ncbi:unnamed protein product [Adineta steineri]|uniref:UBC core domain-containing protein n=4 Tax=Adineta steineri TaxID=433720 RepID=A0A819A6D5_9BILA|nr:unnamed protein product [Adineta steineri]CAF0915305.1 unnamed protein product [Adineta steineri]CAF0973727.1 unnamed protein product [Adineta steineri]CAF3671398.1 unnamed protein product [Adineta steineri]CAF3777265.1 unnamed protein product [Adineta steineri]